MASREALLSSGRPIRRGRSGKRPSRTSNRISVTILMFDIRMFDWLGISLVVHICDGFEKFKSTRSHDYLASDYC